MKIKSLFAAMAMFSVVLASCTQLDNPADYEGGTDEPTVITATEVANLTPSFIAAVSGLEEGQELTPGSTFTLTLTPGDILWAGFAPYHMEHIHVHVGDQVYIPEYPADGGENVQQVSLTIPVPEKPFNVVVAYAVQQQLDPNGFTMRLEDNEDGVQLYGVSQEQKYKYFDCYLRTPEAYTVDKVEFKMGDSQWEDLTNYIGCGFQRVDGVDNVYQVSVRPDYQNVTGDVTLRVSGTQHARSKITWKNTEYVNFDIPEGYVPNNLPESAIGGETVTAVIYTKDDYYLDGATANVEGVNPECSYRSYVTFTMPEEDVEITLDFKEKIPVSYVASDQITAAQLYSAPDIYYGVPVEKAIPGEYVYLFANAEQGYKPLKATNDQGEQSDFVIYGSGLDSYAYYAQVHVPEGATQMTVKAEAVATHYAGGENISFDGGHYYAAGETVTFTVAVPNGKKLENVTAADANGTSVAVNMNGTYGSFTMPDADVTVTATFADIDPSENVTITALYDEDQYRVYSQSSAYYGPITSEGVTVPTGTTLYISVQDDYGEPFWVGVKIGESIQYIEAPQDEETGEYIFGRSFVFSDNAVIKVGATENAVAF